MTNTQQLPVGGQLSFSEIIKTRWLNYRRKRFWAIIVVLLYTLFGFFAAPLIIKNTVVGLFRDDLDRVAQIEKVEVNPYVLSLKMNGFVVNDKDDVKLTAFDELFINFQLSSLFNWAWTFSEISLSGPYLYFERFNTGDSRLDHLLTDFANSQPVEPASEQNEEAAGAVRLLIQNLNINEGRVDVTDNVPATAVETRLAPINISIQQLNTLPDRHGKQSVTIQLPDEASLKWSGSLTLAPLDSEGELVLEGLHLDPLIAYLKSMLPLEDMSAKLSSRLHYRLQEDDSGEIEFNINDLDIDLHGLLLSGLTPVTEFVDIPTISLHGGSFKYPQQSLHFDSLKVDSPQFDVWLDEKGELSLMDLMPVGEDTSTNSQSDMSHAAWSISLAEFSVSDGKLRFNDNTVAPVANVEMTDLQLSLSEVSNQDNALMPLEVTGRLTQGGSYKVNGGVTVFPAFSLSATANTTAIPLSLAQPYIEQFAHIKVIGGVLDSDIEIVLSDEQAIGLNGSIQVPALEINDTLEDQRLLGWEMLDIDHFELTEEELRLSLMTFEQAFARLIIKEDLSTNIETLVVEQEAGTDTDPHAGQMTIVIGGMRLNEAAMDFADFSLPLPFTTHIANLDGTISTIATNSTAPANIKLEGQVDEYGLARIDGNMNMLDPIQHTDVTVEFRNLSMSNLSPYTVQFAGREIDEGKLDLSLVYAVDEGQLHGANDVVLSDLVLGDKVDHPDASSLPLGLAVGLLKDSDGVIKIDLPVEGDINDPEFKIGGVIWQAITGMIGKIVSAPFRFLGKLIGIDSEDLGQFDFLAGRSDLTPPELEKIAQIGEALKQRPELVVEIGGVIDPVIDVPALQYFQIRHIAEQRLEKGLGDEDEKAMMLDVEIRAVVEALFVERFPEIPTDSVKMQHTAAPLDDPEAKPVLDELAYASDLWKRLLASQVISDQDLAELANARAGVISAAFLADGEFDESRIVIAPPEEVESEDGEWVKLELSVASE